MPVATARLFSYRSCSLLAAKRLCKRFIKAYRLLAQSAAEIQTAKELFGISDQDVTAFAQALIEPPVVGGAEGIRTTKSHFPFSTIAIPLLILLLRYPDVELPEDRCFLLMFGLKELEALPQSPAVVADIRTAQAVLNRLENGLISEGKMAGEQIFSCIFLGNACILTSVPFDSECPTRCRAIRAISRTSCENTSTKVVRPSRQPFSRCALLQFQNVSQIR